MDSTQPMNYNQMINMLNNMNNNNMMTNNMNMNQFNQMMNYLQMMNNQNNMIYMNNNPMMNMMMQMMMNNQNMMNMNPMNNMMNNFDMTQYMLIFNQLINNFNNYMKNMNNMNNNQPVNKNKINLIFIVNSDGNERKLTIPAEPNDSLSVVIGRYITKSGDSRVNYYIYAGVRLDESLTVGQQGLTDNSIIYVVGVQNILGAINV